MASSKASGGDLIKRAWEKSAVGEYNLGLDCLTSKKSKAACREYLRNNPDSDFRKEIEDKIGDVLELDEEVLQPAVAIEAQAVGMKDDDDDVALLLYGIYISLFLLTIYLLFRRRKSPGIKLLIVTSCIMAVLGTTQMAVTIAQTAVLYRCYVIWGFRRKVVIVPTLLMLSTFFMGILGTFTDVVTRQMIVSLAAATNLVLTALTGNWSDIMDPARYNTAIKLIIESGAIYCITAIFLVITAALYDEEIYNAGSGIAQQLIVSPGHFSLI
ncbi:hypothetical protein B0H13DRAFT_2344658 [Mycena leptocephala]|nr:hypothetical protein B0H13DRAFT_2344658 [Mycena leptocephala]